MSTSEPICGTLKSERASHEDGNRGALVISLDFELHWGVRDSRSADGPYRANLLGVRQALPRILSLFEEFDIAATWATVGFLFARNRADLEHFSPPIQLRPTYAARALDPYGETIGEDESDDLLHFGGDLIAQIRACPRQEIATHTFSHYYCLEDGQTSAQFAADLDAARRIAARDGIEIRSIVFPRNQFNAAYDPIARDAGIRCLRGNERGWMYRAATSEEQSAPMRAARLADAYFNLSGHNLSAWNQIARADGLCDVPSSRFLRPHSRRLRALEGLRLRRIVRSLQVAARTRRIFHLWWHPHNFGVDIDENIAFLRRILSEFAILREREGMQSLSMNEVAAKAKSSIVNPKS